MDSTELAESLEEVGRDTPHYETLILDFDDKPAWWACNLDGREIDPDKGCPDHRPNNIPGLRLVDCENDPPHLAWVVDGDHCGYGVPCFRCEWSRLHDMYQRETKQDRCYHGGWRRWRLTHKVAGWLYESGICASGGGKIFGGPDHGGCLDVLPHLRGKRVYILGVRRETWRCWLKGRHRRGEEVGFGFCGKCVPMPCCGSQTVEHVTGCADDEHAAVTP